MKMDMQQQAEDKFKMTKLTRKKLKDPNKRIQVLKMGN